MLMRKINAWLYGIEQRVAKWKRSRTPEYRAGKKAYRDWKHWNQNPYAKTTEEHRLWREGWLDEELKHE